MKNKEKYNNDFLFDFKFQIQNPTYVPEYHIQPRQGLLNDPNCTFYKNNKLYCFFQHHPVKPVHNLKTVSLATTIDFANFKYDYMVNKPLNDFDNCGIYSGSSLVYKNKVHCLYSGNHRDVDNVRDSSIIHCNYDIDHKTFINKTVLITQSFFKNKYTEHFRDPFIFKRKNIIYFLLGAQSLEGEGLILLFKISENFKKVDLIKEFSFASKNYRMIECPNVFFINDKAYIIYSPQDKLLSTNKNHDHCGYSILGENVFFSLNSSIIESFYELDYGPHFYAAQIFFVKNTPHLIAWSGLPTITNLPETKFNWVHCFSMIKKIQIKNNKIVLSEKSSFKKIIKINSSNKVSYLKRFINVNQTMKIICDKKIAFTIKKLDKNIVISQENTYCHYENEKIIKNNEIRTKLEMFLDNSILEIKISNLNWYTSRIYFSKNIEIKMR